MPRRMYSWNFMHLGVDIVRIWRLSGRIWQKLLRMIKMYGPVLVIGFVLVGKINVGWSLDGLVLCFCCFERDVDFRLLLRRLMPRLRPVSQRLMAFNLILKSD